MDERLPKEGIRQIMRRIEENIEERERLIRELADARMRQRVPCPHCGKRSQIGSYKLVYDGITDRHSMKEVQADLQIASIVCPHCGKESPIVQNKQAGKILSCDPDRFSNVEKRTHDIS